MKYLPISDDAHASGTRYSDFVEYMEGFDDSTFMETWVISFLTFVAIIDTKTPFEKRILVRKYDPMEQKAIVGYITLPDAIYHNKQLMRDLEAQRFYITYTPYGDGSLGQPELFFVPSSNMNHTLCGNFVGVSVDTPLIERLALIQRYFFEGRLKNKGERSSSEEVGAKANKPKRAPKRPEKGDDLSMVDKKWLFKCIYRVDKTAPADEADKCRKIFSVQGRNYCFIPQRILCDIVEELRKHLGKENCYGWTIDHYKSQITLLYPAEREKFADILGRLPDRMMPGVKLRTSDCGESSLSVSSVFVISRLGPNGNAVQTEVQFGDPYRRVHKGEIPITEVIDGSARLWKNFKEVPERLAELLSVDIRYQDVPEVLNGVVKTCDYSKKRLFGKRKSQEYIQLIARELGVPYALDDDGEMMVKGDGTVSAYDIALEFMSSPDRLENLRKKEADEKAAIEDIKSRIGLALTYDFERFAVDADGNYLNAQPKDAKLRLKPSM